MKKEKLINIITIIVISLVTHGIIVYASDYLFSSNIVSYNNTTSGLASSNVQCAIDELYNRATDYTEVDTRVTSLESIIGNNTLTTTSQTLTGSINELKNKTSIYYGSYTPTITCSDTKFVASNIDFRYSISGGLLWISGRFNITTAATNTHSEIYLSIPNGYTIPSTVIGVGSCGNVHLNKSYSDIGLSLRIRDTNSIFIQAGAGGVNAGKLIGATYVTIDAVVPINI